MFLHHIIISCRTMSVLCWCLASYTTKAVYQIGEKHIGGKKREGMLILVLEREKEPSYPEGGICCALATARRTLQCRSFPSFSLRPYIYNITVLYNLRKGRALALGYVPTNLYKRTIASVCYKAFNAKKVKWVRS